MDGNTRDKKKAERKSRKEERSRRKAERKEKRAADDKDKGPRRLTQLYNADDDALEKLHQQRPADGVTLEQLRQMRAVVVSLDGIINSDTVEAWGPLQAVYEALCEDEQNAAPSATNGDAAAAAKPALVSGAGVALAPKAAPPLATAPAVVNGAGVNGAGRGASPWATGSAPPPAPPAPSVAPTSAPVSPSAVPRVAPPRPVAGQRAAAAPVAPARSSRPAVPPPVPRRAPTAIAAGMPAAMAAADKVQIQGAAPLPDAPLVPALAMTMDGSDPADDEAVLPFEAAPESGVPASRRTETDAKVPRALPFESRSAPPSQRTSPPALSIEQYASLCAELAAKPAAKDDTLARYQIAAATAKQALDEAWTQRFDADSALRTRYEQLVRYYTQWYQQNQG